MPAPSRGGHAALGALEHQDVFRREVDRGRRAAFGRRDVGVVEDVERDRILAEADADADHRAEEAHLLDGALHAIGTAMLVVEEDRLRPKRHRTHLVVLEAAHAARGDDRLIVDRDPPARRIDHASAQDVERADEGGDEAGARVVVDLERRADLLDPTLVHDDDAVGHRQRFFLVVGDVDGGDAECALQRADFLAERHADLGIERGERFVEEKDLRLRPPRARASATRCCWPPES